MRHHLVLLLAASLLTVGTAAGQSSAPGYQPPTTAWGVPDLQGTWTNASITDLQRSAQYKDLVISEEDAARMEGADYYNNRTREDAKRIDVAKAELLDGTDLLSGGGYNAFWVDPGTRVGRVKGTLRSSWIVDPPIGRIPYKNRAGPNPPASSSQPTSTSGLGGTATAIGPGGVNPNAGGELGSYANIETRPLGERCLVFGRTGGPVMTNGLYNNNYQIVQTPDHVVILVEMIHETRIIPLTRDRQRPDAIQPWGGDSIGWYEGDTLVVETRNANPKQGGYVSSEGKLTERFSRWNDDQITYEFTVEDPSQYSQPWRGEMAYNRSSGPIFEFACHEGNYAMAGILAGARKQEREGKTVEANFEEEG